MSDTTLLEAVRRWEPPSADELAAQIPGVAVERLIARGGMAAVYLAHQQSLDRAVALKVLPPELGRIEGFNERFESEARVLARLHHPSVVTVYDFGRTAAGSAYIVMELVSGESLANWGRGRSIAEKLSVAVRVIEGVAYLHRQGVVHADLKPDNVMVEADGHVRILDFGLATRIRATSEVEAPRFGSPPYTAPEAYRADARPDPRSDVYSLGQTLCELFGERAPPVHPDAAELENYLGNRDLALAIWPMIRLRPEDRPSSLDDTLTRLGQAMRQPRPAAGPRPRAPSTPVASGKKPRRNAWGYAASFVAVVSAAVALRHWQRPATPPPSATTPASATAAREAVALPPLNDDAAEADAIFREASAAVAPPAPAPATSTPPAVAPPEASIEPRAAVTSERRVAVPANAKMRELNEKFLAALEREREKAADAQMAAVLNDEIERMTAEQSVPDTDPPELPESLQRLRAIYREQRDRAADREPPGASSPPAISTTHAPTPAPLKYAPFDDAPRRANDPKPPTDAAKQPARPTPDPSKPQPRITLYWRCAERAEFLVNGHPTEATAARGTQFGPSIWKAEVDISEGDVLGFKLFSKGLERDFAALAKAGNRLLFVTDAKWQTIEGEPGPDWWTGEDKRGAEPRRLNSKEYNNRLIQDFCGFTDVPRGNVLACWGAHPARSNIRRVITTFDVRTALGVAAK